MMPSPHLHRPHDGTLIRFWCRSEPASIVGSWSRRFLGWVAYHEAIPLIRHDVTGWEPIADQAAAKAAPLAKARRAGATTVVVGVAKAPPAVQPHQLSARRISQSWWWGGEGRA